MPCPQAQSKQQNGATLVEFAIVVPLLLLLMFAIMEFGRLGFYFTEIWTAAREGARHATTIEDGNSNGLPNFVDCDDIKARALAKVTMQDLTAAEVTVDYLDSAGTKIADCDPGGPYESPTTSGNIDPGTQIQVTVALAYEAIVPLVGSFVDGVPLDSTQTRSVHYGVPE